MITLNIIWFVLIVVLLLAYAILEGFDLGVGILHPFARKDEERRIMMNAIGPVWDGNEVWLITFGGALFAAFPTAYAVAFSSYYTPFMMLLCALIFRAASMEFRSKKDSKLWRAFWDFVFSLSSIIATFLLGVAGANTMIGLPIDDKGIFHGSFFSFLNPLGITSGILALLVFALQGALYLQFKTEGELKFKMLKISKATSLGVVILFAVVTLLSFYSLDRAKPNLVNSIFGLISILFLVGTLVNIWRENGKLAFFMNSFYITSLVLIFASNMFPDLVRSSINPDYSLTIYNSASSPKTLAIMMGIVLTVLPFVLAYTGYVYWVFRGPVKLDESSY